MKKNGFSNKPSDILMLDICNHGFILRLKKQRFLCHQCNKKFFATTTLVNPNCTISNQVKHAIALELKNKISEKDIAKRYRVSPNTVERIIDSYYDNKKLYKHYLPEILSFDEFKSVKSANGAMSFHMCDGKIGKTIDIVEDRRLFSLMKYFAYYTHKARSKVMKKDKKNYNKLKRYWKLILKSFSELNNSKWKKWKCFDNMMTQSDVVDYLINTDEELKETYNMYQNLLFAIKNNKYINLKNALNNVNNKISSYMKTSIKTLKKYLPHIKNTLSNNYSNGFIEGNNNFIKVLKRIAFGFRSFTRFKARIMICKNLLHTKKVNA